jgi:hypothetical protein
VLLRFVHASVWPRPAANGQWPVILFFALTAVILPLLVVVMMLVHAA